MTPEVFLLLNLVLAFYNVGTIWAHEVGWKAQTEQRPAWLREPLLREGPLYALDPDAAGQNLRIDPALLGHRNDCARMKHSACLLITAFWGGRWPAVAEGLGTGPVAGQAVMAS